MLAEKKSPTVAVIVLNYNSWYDTVECVAQFSKQKYAEYLIIMVDNASQDDSLEKIRAELLARCGVRGLVEYEQMELEKVGTSEAKKIFQTHPQERVVLIKNRRNLGYSAGNNVGIRYAFKKGADAVLIVNPDVRIDDPESIGAMIDVLFSKEDILVVGPNVIDSENKCQGPLREPSFLQECTIPFLNMISRLLGGSAKGYLKPILSDSPYSVEKLPGCCLMLRASFLKKSGLLDENVFLYCEESIIAEKVKRYGGVIFFLPNVVVRHLHKKSSKGHWKEFYKSRRYYFVKYRGYTKLQVGIIMTLHRIIGFILRQRTV